MPSHPLRALALVQAVGSVQKALPSSPAKVFNLPQYSFLRPLHRSLGIQASVILYYNYLLMLYPVMLHTESLFLWPAFKGNDDSIWTF